MIICEGLFMQEVGMAEVRMLYRQAATEEEAAEQLLEALQKEDSSKALLIGYLGAAHMFKAKYVGNPFSKMSHFKKGKAFLEESIKNSPANPELRFLRFAVQSEAPGFLGYSGQMEADKAILLEGLKEVPDRDTRESMRVFMLKSDELTEEEKKILSKMNMKK